MTDERKHHKAEIELKKAFGKIEVLSIDNDSLKSDRDNAWSKAIDLKKERDEARAEVERLKQELTDAIKNRNIAREWQDVSAKRNHKFAMELKESTEAIAAIENEGNNHRAEIQRLTGLCNQMESEITQARAEVSRMQDACAAELEQMRKVSGARAEPSRLEIAAQFMVGSFLGAGEKITNKQAFKMADALIAAAKEAK